MLHGQPVIDADSHKCENPVVFADYIDAAYRDRFSIVRDRYGEQRFQIRDRDPATGCNDFDRVFLQPDGYGKGTYRPYHAETTIGGLFNRVRIEHMDREGIDHQLIYGSVVLAFSSVIDRELAVALCRAYNDYIHDDCGSYADRLHPVGVLPMQDPSAAVDEMRRCVEDLGMAGVSIAPHVPVPHPSAPEAFPEIRVPKQLSHPDFFPLYEEAERLDVALGIHGAPGVQLAAGCADLLDSFTLVHVFANRGMQQMALAKLIFDGVLEAHPRLRVGFLEAGVGWLPDFMHSLHEHWEKRIANFDPSVEPSVARFLYEFARERNATGRIGAIQKGRQLMNAMFVSKPADSASPQEMERFLYEHPLDRDPLEYLERGQLFFTVEPDDPAPGWLPEALGDVGRRLCGLAIDYGHWDATLAGCLELLTRDERIDEDYATRLASTNARAFYGEPLERCIAHATGSVSAIAGLGR